MASQMQLVPSGTNPELPFTEISTTVSLFFMLFVVGNKLQHKTVLEKKIVGRLKENKWRREDGAGAGVGAGVGAGAGTDAVWVRNEMEEVDYEGLEEEK
ncbi:50S ribosomal protein L7/L12 domain protein [Onchocerca flexuosa]|uniref:50S ribosomal protein L7/L12 domain protein n=1 Tax=Onchocerca flexuosa TaxID=387005 RepID=A0A238C0G7_9BILA|nr:50S ribosomal protein L7/L12 domain protein [Onchocerca flexuosa]